MLFSIIRGYYLSKHYALQARRVVMGRPLKAKQTSVTWQLSQTIGRPDIEAAKPATAQPATPAQPGLSRADKATMLRSHAVAFRRRDPADPTGPVFTGRAPSRLIKIPQARPPLNLRDNLPKITGPQRRLIKRTRTSGTWGGDVELVGLARMLGITIHVCQLDHHGRGRTVAGKVLHTVNEGARRYALLAYDGTHYTALLPPMLHEGLLPNGRVSAYFAETPPDGDCLYHAVAEAAGLTAVRVVASMYRSGSMEFIRSSNRVLKELIPNADGMTDDEVYRRFRKAYVYKLRESLAQEFRRPEYIEMAANSEAAEG